MAGKTSHTIVGGLLAVALVTGLGMSSATGATAATPASAVAALASEPRHRTVMVFPDPISCHIAGQATGRAYYCAWMFPLPIWALNVAI